MEKIRLGEAQLVFLAEVLYLGSGLSLIFIYLLPIN
jgi:hypothetical protein